MEMRNMVVGDQIDEISEEKGKLWNKMKGERKLRWIGKEKGEMKIEKGDVVKEIWDLIEKKEGKKVWRMVQEIQKEEIEDIVDYSYMKDVMKRDEEIEIMRKDERGKEESIEKMEEEGYE